MEVQRRAVELGLQPLRWPDPFPFDSALAMRAATYAKSIGRVVAFAQAAFRQAFAGGRSLGETDRVLIAAAACEMHPSAVLRAAELRSTAEQLAAATAAAAELGVTDVPAVRVGERVFLGERALEQAAAHVAAALGDRDEGQPRLPADRAPRRARPGAARRPRAGSTTSRSSRSTAARSCCSGTCPPHAASRLARALRADLSQLDAEEFLARWSTVEA